MRTKIKSLILFFFTFLFCSCEQKGIAIFDIALDDYVNIAAPKMYHRMKQLDYIPNKYKSYNKSQKHVWYVIKDKEGNYERYEIFSFNKNNTIDSIYFESNIINSSNIFIFHKNRRLYGEKHIDVTQNNVRTICIYSKNNIKINTFKTK